MTQAELLAVLAQVDLAPIWTLTVLMLAFSVLRWFVGQVRGAWRAE